MNVLLAGDIGGTHTRLAAYRFDAKLPEADRLSCINLAHYSSQDFAQFEDLLTLFLKESAILALDCMVLAVAGPVIDGHCQATNLPWELNAEALAKAYRIRRVELLNDIAAAGLGLLQMHERDLVQINPNALLRPGHRAIMSIGTGLGEAFLIWNGQRHVPFPGEGGHEDFAPMDEADIHLWRFLRKKYPDHISYERVLSGPGIEMLYHYCCDRSQVKHFGPSTNLSAYVTKMATEGKNQLCLEAMNIFTRFLASEAANLCLKLMATGGIYITGGIAPRIESILRQPLFYQYFIRKGRFKSLMTRVPVWICRNENAPLDGALQRARELIAETGT
jgi:glucokinase